LFTCIEYTHFVCRRELTVLHISIFLLT